MAIGTYDYVVREIMSLVDCIAAIGLFAFLQCSYLAVKVPRLVVVSIQSVTGFQGELEQVTCNLATLAVIVDM